MEKVRSKMRTSGTRAVLVMKKILEVLKKHWEVAQFLIIGMVLLLVSIWSGIVYSLSGYHLNENVMIVGIGILITSGVVMIATVILKESIKNDK